MYLVLSGTWELSGRQAAGELATTIAITYGYSRDHREDLKHRMLARASTQEGDVPRFSRVRGAETSSDKVMLAAVVEKRTSSYADQKRA